VSTLKAQCLDFPYLLIVVDEHSRFPFVFLCKNIKSSTVTQCLSSLFCLFGFPGCVHSDRGALLSRETISFLTTRGISFSTSTPYHPQGIASANVLTKTFGAHSSCCCIANVFRRKPGSFVSGSPSCRPIPCLPFHK